MILGIDVGGTFTDLVLVKDTGEKINHKVSSTPEDPSMAVVRGAREIAEIANVALNDIQQVFHGTTIATNIVLQHKGAEVGIITTEGFRDILHIARHKRPYNFSLYQDLPWQKYPLVKRRNRLTVPERITAEGEIMTPLDEEKVLEQIKKLKEANVDAIAVCLLFSFKNSANEDRVKEMIQKEFTDVFISVSNEVLPQYREYERFSTVALNAYIGPETSNYIQKIINDMKEVGINTELHLMQSNGGIATSQMAIEKPVNLLLSGPVAGLIGGIHAAKSAGFHDVITLDIGGTSADIGVAPGGEKKMKHLLDTRIGKYNAMIPMVDIDAIGAGGGSIASVDEGSIFRVGPQSAGAEPGPACYNRGGELPTATDAQVLLGRIRGNSKLAGGLEINPQLAESAYKTHVADKLDMDPMKAAAGAVRIMTHNMVNAIEMNSVRKGYDPRDFTLVAAGGAGPLFSCDIAEELNIPTVVVPPNPGTIAANGLIETDINYEQVSTVWSSIESSDLHKIEKEFKKLEDKTLNLLKQDGIKKEDITIKRICDCRYEGQGYELRVDAPNGEINEEWAEVVESGFHQAHEREYASKFLDQKVFIINIRVVAVGEVFNDYKNNEGINEPEIEFVEPEKADVYFWVDDELEKVETKFYNRAHIPLGTELTGPAIIEQIDSTTVIPPNCSAIFDKAGNIVIDMQEKIERKINHKNLSLNKS